MKKAREEKQDVNVGKVRVRDNLRPPSDLVAVYIIAPTNDEDF